MICRRYVPAACVLVALALVPTLIHSYSDERVADGRSAASLPSILDGRTSTPTNRSATWGKRRFDSDDWVERVYSKPGRRDDLRLTVVRSYDAKALYHHPELAVTYGTSFAGEETLRLETRPDIPLHFLKPDVAGRARAVYALHYEDAFIEDPIVFQLKNAGELLFRRRQPLTLFFVTDAEADAAEPIDQWPAVPLLMSAIDAFLGR